MSILPNWNLLKTTPKENIFIILLPLLNFNLFNGSPKFYALWTPKRRKYFCTRFWKQNMYLVSQQANKIFFLWPIKRKNGSACFLKKQIHNLTEVISYFTYDFNKCLSLERSVWKIIFKKTHPVLLNQNSEFTTQTVSSFSLYQFRDMRLTMSSNNQLLMIAVILQ